jgi:hypothetical protein
MLTLHLHATHNLMQFLKEFIEQLATCFVPLKQKTNQQTNLIPGQESQAQQHGQFVPHVMLHCNQLQDTVSLWTRHDLGRSSCCGLAMCQTT